ncbi:MAG: tetratricopeptide repeat protein [Prosthecobacter sp.]|uniref:tetratricopeptide repeat protein n=1 Tax=Prosthecobacter sp. TaxID=1965333 RepID=UPI0038FF7CAF
MALRDTQPARTVPVFNRQRLLVMMVCMMLILMVFVVYWQTREFAFVNFDDGFFVYKNQHVLRGLTWENVRWSLTAGVGKDAADLGDADYWRPVSLMSHMLDVSLFGLRAGAHHLMSVLLHALTSVALFMVLRSLTSALWRSAFVAALFAVHPLHVESVAWVAERKDVLSGLFFVLTLGAYLRFARHSFRWSNYILMLLMAALAMMSKPMLVTTPCVLLLVDLWPLNRLGNVPLKQLLMEKIPIFVMAAITASLTLSGGGAANDALWGTLSWHYRVGNALLSYGIYIWQTVWPAELTCFYPFPGIYLPLGQTWLAIAVLVVITALVGWQHARRFLVVGWLWYLGMLVPVVGLFRQAGDQAHADRYTYLSMIGLSLMVTWSAAEWAGKVRARRLALGSMAAVALLVLSITAHSQVAHWRNTLALWTHAVECNPEDCAAYASLGTALIEAGRQSEAVESYRHALVLSPYHVQARMNLGITLLRMGRIDEAELQLRRTVLDDPQSTDAHSTLGFIFLHKGEQPKAIRHFMAAADIRPDVAAWCNLGNAQMQAGQVPAAIDSFLRALKVNPAHADSHFSLGVAHASQGKQKAAKEHYQQALAADPNHLPALNNLAWLLATSKDDSLRSGTQAVELMEHALQLPGGSRLHLLHTLAAAYAEVGQYPKAAAAAQQALSLAASFPGLAHQLQMERGAYLAGTPWRE